MKIRATRHFSKDSKSKKFCNENFPNVQRTQQILTKFNSRYHLELFDSSTKFKPDKSKFARVGKFRAIVKKSKSHKI